MKYLLSLIILVSVGCIRGPGYNKDSADSLGIYLGHSYAVKNGFYKGCTGIATQYTDMTYNDDTVMLSEVTCNNANVNFISTEAKNLKSN